MLSCCCGGGDASILEPEFKLEFELLGGETTIKFWVSCDDGGVATGVEEEALWGLELEFSSTPELELVGGVRLDICWIFLLKFCFGCFFFSFFLAD